MLVIGTKSSISSSTKIGNTRSFRLNSVSWNMSRRVWERRRRRGRTAGNWLGIMVPDGQVHKTNVKTDEPWPRLNGATNTGLNLQMQNIRPACGRLSRGVFLWEYPNNPQAFFCSRCRRQRWGAKHPPFFDRMLRSCGPCRSLRQRQQTGIAFHVEHFVKKRNIASHDSRTAQSPGQ